MSIKILQRVRGLRFPTFDELRTVATSALLLVSTLLVLIGIYQSTVSDAISFEPLQVPAGFTEKGYTPQISTTRLVDEIRKINAVATTTKARSSVSRNQPGEELTKISSLPLPMGIDIHAIQSLVRDLLGIESRTINGDITISGEGKEKKYFVRIRQSPENLLLVDELIAGDPEEVLRIAAMKIIETLDPVVAASYYRNKKQISEALRMIEHALTNDKPGDDTYALSQRAQIYLSQKKYELAKADLDNLLAIDPKSPQGLGVQSYWYNDQGFFKEGLEYAERQMKAKPDMWHAYFNKAEALIGLKLDAEKEFLEGIKHRPNRGWAYVDASEYLEKKGRSDLASSILKQGVGRFPDSLELNIAYGKKALKDGHQETAISYLKRAYCIAPENSDLRALLLEALPLGKEDLLRKELLSKANKLK